MSFVIHFYASTVPNIEILLNRYDASLIFFKIINKSGSRQIYN